MNLSILKVLAVQTHSAFTKYEEHFQKVQLRDATTPLNTVNSQ